MKSLKTSRQFKGSPIGLRALCQLEARSLPFSVRDVVADDGVRSFSGRISTGDVDCDWAMNLWQNGFWGVKGDFRDNGAIAGDFFSVEFLLAEESVGARLDGSILDVADSRHLSVSKNGSDRWVRENWHRFESSGPSVRLHVAPAYGEIVVVVAVALAAAAAAIFGGQEAKPCGEWETNPAPGSACIHLQMRQPGDPSPPPN
jgi:hypothetical protein